MKKIGLFLAGAIALVTLFSCTDEEEYYPERENKLNEEAYAAQATVTSSDANYVAGDNGGTISFKTEGGSATLTISCGCNWIAENSATDLFTTSATSSSLTITAGQNTVEEDLTGTITFMTETYKITFATVYITQTAYGAPEITVETTEWAAPAKGALSTEIAVEASADWTVESGAAWLTASKSGDGITLSAEENGDTKGRSTRVTLTCTDGIRTAREYVAVTQDGLAYLTLSNESLSFSSDEGSASVTVESNYDWDYSYDSSNGWFTVSKSDDGLTVTVVENDEDDRAGIVTITAGDGAENVTEAQLEISQESTINNLILTYNITSANTKTQLPLSGTVDCTVNWGDGTVEEITSTQPSHTYASAGEYDISIKGTVTALSSNSISTNTSPLPLTAVKQWGNTGLTSLSYAFYYCKSLVSLPEITGNAFADVTDASSMFHTCSALESIPKGLFDNAHLVTTFESCFRGCSALTELPAGLFGDCPAVTDMSYLCYSCTGLTSLPSGLFDKFTAVTNFSYGFQSCSSLETVPAGLFDSFTAVTNLMNCFTNSGLKEVPKGFFDNCTSVTNFSYCFQNCTSLETVPEGLFDNCTEVTNFGRLFNGCSALKEIPAGFFDNCTKVTDFSYCFYNCKAIKTVPEGLFANASSTTTFAYLFYGCSALEEILAGLFDNCTSATNFSYCFYGCSILTEIPVNLFKDCTAVTNFSYCFNSGNSSVHNLTGESAYDLVEIDGVETMIHLYDRGDYADIYTTPTSTSYCYRYQTELNDYNSLPSGWY